MHVCTYRYIYIYIMINIGIINIVISPFEDALKGGICAINADFLGFSKQQHNVFERFFHVY